MINIVGQPGNLSDLIDYQQGNRVRFYFRRSAAIF